AVVMSSASSAVTYTSIYIDSEPGRVFWGANEKISDGGSPRVIIYGYDGLTMQLPHDPDYVPKPIYPEYIPLEDEHDFSAEEQPLPPGFSPTNESPRYVTKSDPEEDPEEYEDDETEDGPVDYPMDGGEDGNDDGDDSSRDDTDDEDEDDGDEDDEEEEEEEDEHLAPADSAVVVPIVELVSPPEGTGLVIPPPSTDITTTGARITIWLQASISLPPEAEVERLLAMPTPPPSPPISLSPPFVGERLSRIASTQALIDAVTVALPSPPLPPPIDRRDDIPEFEQPPRKRLCLYTLGSRYEVGESSTARPIGGRGKDYGFVSTMDAEARRQGISEVGVTKLAEFHKRDTQDLYALLEDAQDSRTRISQRVAIDPQRVDLLMGDRVTLQETVWIVEEEAYASLEAWAHTIGLSQTVHHELQTHRTKGVVSLTRWIEKMESVFNINGYAIENHVKVATCTLLGVALTWWNGQIGTLGPDAYSMTWEVLKKKMTDKYCL
ncbi:hypothetical protein Tco_1232692, partial [Tanacetum coccineum]